MIIVLPAPGMPGQNNICCLWFTHSWNAFDSSSHSPVPANEVTMLSGVVDRCEPIKDELMFFMTVSIVLSLVQLIHSLPRNV
jgi:hypothetical protein